MASVIETSVPGEPCEFCQVPTTMRTATLSGGDGIGNGLTMRVFTCDHADQTGYAKVGDRQGRRDKAEELYKLGRDGGSVTPSNWRRMRRLDIDWEAADLKQHGQMLAWFFDTLQDRVSAGDGLFMWGRRGNGKSMIGAVVLTEAESRGIAGRFERASDLVSNWIRGEDVAAYRRHVCRVPVLVIDELGIETPSAISLEALFGVIDDRYSNNRTTIITTNLTAADLAGRYATVDREAMARLIDRLTQSAPVLEFKGDGYRRQIRPNYWAIARQHAEQVAKSATEDVPDWKD